MVKVKELNDYVFPLILTQLVQYLISQVSLHYAVANSTMILSSISVIQNLLFAFGGILGAFSLAFNIKGSQALAQKQKSLFQDLVASSFWINIIVGTCFILFVILFGKSFLQFFYGFNGRLLMTSYMYLLISSPYIFLTLCCFLFASILKVERKTKPLFWIGFSSAILDVIFNYFLVPILGIVGAGLSVILTLTLTVLAYLVLIFPTFITSLVHGSSKKRELILLGQPLLFQEILESVLLILVFDALMGRQGLSILAVYSVVSQLFSLVRMPVLMYAGALPIFLPDAKDAHGEQQFIKLILKLSYFSYLLFASLAVITIHPFAHFLTNHIQNNLIPYILFTVLVMLATPAYESYKMLLQSQEYEKWVLHITTLINGCGVTFLLVLQILNLQSYFSLYAVFGASLWILSYCFKKKVKCK